MSEVGVMLDTNVLVNVLVEFRPDLFKNEHEPMAEDILYRINKLQKEGDLFFSKTVLLEIPGALRNCYTGEYDTQELFDDFASYTFDINEENTVESNIELNAMRNWFFQIYSTNKRFQEKIDKKREEKDFYNFMKSDIEILHHAKLIPRKIPIFLTFDTDFLILKEKIYNTHNILVNTPEEWFSS